MKYISVPVSAAKEIAEKFEKQEVIVLSVDRIHEKVHITTYGKTPKNCENAAATGDFMREVFELEKSDRYFELVERCKQIWKESNDQV